MVKMTILSLNAPNKGFHAWNIRSLSYYNAFLLPRQPFADLKIPNLVMPMLSTLDPVAPSQLPSKNRHDHDKVLWGNFRGGCSEALASLYRRHNSGMFQHGLFWCKDPDLVRDSMQELFSRLWSRRDRISDADCVQAYLYQSLKRLLLVQVMRKRQRSVPLEGANEPVESSTLEESYITQELRKEQAQVIRRALDCLTHGQREVIVLRYFNGLSYPQISEIMDLRIESVYNHASKAIEQLRQVLQLGAPVAVS
jgi:RNA polymerase sigma factor (sigma-70 family)